MVLIKGVGDRGGLPSSINNVKVPSYNCWLNMLQRCYDKAYQERQPTYKGCTVCKEWLYYPTFKVWYDENYKEGFQLDKDLLKKDNKVYCPKYCRFIPREINSMFQNCNTRRGKFPKGVSYFKYAKNKPYQAQLSKDGKNTLIGRYATVEEAEKAYLLEKDNYVKKKSLDYFKKGLICEQLYKVLNK